MTFTDGLVCVLNTVAPCFVCWRVQRWLMRPSNTDAQIIEGARWAVHDSFEVVGRALSDAMPLAPRTEAMLAREVRAGRLSEAQADIIRAINLTPQKLSELGRRVHFDPRRGRNP